MPKSHPASGSPEQWFSNEVLPEQNLFGFSFDFFVNWTTNSITPVIWIKRILDHQFTYRQVADNINDVMIEEFGLNYLNRLASFCFNYSLETQIIIFKDEQDWNNEESEILIVTFQKEGDGLIFEAEIIGINEFKNRIRTHSGGPISIGSKGLMYSTSRLECALSNTDSLYPGDVDMVILEPTNLVNAIIEFKKHTLSDSIDGQSLSRHYPVPDKRKYDRLAILRDYLTRSPFKVPLLVLYYPTRPNFSEGKLELVTGRVGSLASNKASKFTLPTQNLLIEYVPVLTKVMRAVDYFQSS